VGNRPWLTWRALLSDAVMPSQAMDGTNLNGENDDERTETQVQ